MKTLLVMAIATVSLLATSVSWAQSANMMNVGTWGAGWMGGDGGIGMPILLGIVIAVLVKWLVKRGGK